MAKITIALASWALTAKVGEIEIYSAKHEGREYNVHGAPVADVIVETEASFTANEGTDKERVVTFARVENTNTLNSARTKAVKTKAFMTDFGGFDAYKETLEVMKMEAELNKLQNA